MNAKILILLLGGLGLPALKTTAQSLAPSVVAASGGTAVDGQVQVAWTLGESIIRTAGAVTQGFHGAELQALSGTESVASGGLVQVFPNPVGRTLTLRFKGVESRTAMQAVVWNALTQQLLVADIAPDAVSYDLDCTALPPGVHWLTLRNKQGATLATVPFVKN